MLVTRPSRSARPLDAAARGPRCRPRSDCTPSAISTTAPASLTTVNTVADGATTAPRPGALPGGKPLPGRGEAGRQPGAREGAPREHADRVAGRADERLAPPAAC